MDECRFSLEHSCGTFSGDGVAQSELASANAEWNRKMTQYKALLATASKLMSACGVVVDGSGSGGASSSSPSAEWTPESYTPAAHVGLEESGIPGAFELADEIGDAVLDADAAANNMWYLRNPDQRRAWMGKWVYVLDGKISREPFDDLEDAFVACDCARSRGPRCAYVVQVRASVEVLPRTRVGQGVHGLGLTGPDCTPCDGIVAIAQPFLAL